jgi:serine/threonine protein kinase/tetratricopeptide (TPR) repeat protein
MIGENISHYKILEKLGSGGMGVVYKAEDTKLHRTVALKFLPPAFSLDKETKQKFIHEAQTASALQHNNICNIHSIDETEDGQLFICIDYYEGETLKSKLSKESLSSDEIINITTQIAEGLQKAHEKGIVHRDIKPANIFITNEGIVKILDFGLAKSSGSAQINDIVSTTGTCNYMSPEQALGEEVDQGTDIWALGIVMYEMLTGKLPFDSDHDQAIIYSILNIELDLEKLNTQLPEGFCSIIFKCLNKNKNQRYQQIEELIPELAEIKKDSSINYSVLQPKLPSFFDYESGEAIVDRTVLVAREQELEKLEKHLNSALVGKSQLVFVTGESGAGKTALVKEFSIRAQKMNADLIVVNGKCNAHTGFGDPYFPFIELLNLLTGDIESKYKAGVISREHALRLWKLARITCRAIIENGTDLINIFTNGTLLVSRACEFGTGNLNWLVQLKKLVKNKSALPIDLTLQQSNIFEQYTRVIQSVSEENPMLIILDDLQWIDAGSANLFFHIARQIKGSRIFIIGSFRKTEITIERDGKRHPMETVFNELKRDYGEIEIDLDKLEGQKFVDAYLDIEANNLGDEFRKTLFMQTKGHPLFTIELFREMKEHGMIVRDQAGRWIEGKTFDWKRLPSRIDAVITERINRLTKNMRDILLIASIEGEEFSAEVAARQLKMDEKELIRILSTELEKRHQLVTAKGIKTLVKQRISWYTFRHIMFQKYLYNTLDEVERVHLHEEVGNIIEELYGENVDEVSVQLARHFQEAGITTKAFEYLVKAGTRALHLSAYEETIVLFKKAFNILKSFPESVERDQQELNLQMAMATASQILRGFGTSEIIAYCNRIEELCKKLGDAPQVFYSLYFLSHINWMLGNHKIAFKFTTQMMQHAQKVNDAEKVAITHWLQGTLHFYLGNLIPSLEQLNKMNNYYIPEKCSHLKYINGYDPGLMSGITTACVLWCLGYPDQATLQSQKMLTDARLIDHSMNLVACLALDSLTNILRRDYPRLIKQGKEMYDLSKENGFLLFIGAGLFKMGFAFIHQGKVQEGIKNLHQALDVYNATGMGFTRTELLGSIAEAYGINSDIEKAMDFMEQALTEVQRGGEQYYEVELFRIKGELILMQTDKMNKEEVEKQAEECFQQSVAIAQRQMAKSFELRSTLSLCRLLQKQSKKEEARQLLTKIYNWFTEGFETQDLIDAKALLKELNIKSSEKV